MKYKNLNNINNSSRKIIQTTEDDELELMQFLLTIKSGDNNNGKNYTVFRALKRPSLDDDLIVTMPVQNKQIQNNLSELANLDTFYFSINSFKKYRSEDKEYNINGKSFNPLEVRNREANLNMINCIAFDIDFKDNEEFVNIDYVKENAEKILKPTFIINSGNGCHIYYNLYNLDFICNSDEKLIRIASYRELCKNIANEFARYNIKCDPAVVGDASRILRLPTSYNTKNGEVKKTSIYYSDTSIIYRFIDLKKQFRISEEKVKEIVKTANKQIKAVNNKYGVIENGFTTPKKELNKKRKTQYKYTKQMIENRLSDIKMFVCVKKHYEGRRNNLLFLVYAMLVYNNELGYTDFDCEKEINEINQLFDVPLKQKEVDNIIKYKDALLYNISLGNIYETTNQTWVDYLGLTEIDQTYSLEIMSAKEAERRAPLLRERFNKEQYEKESNRRKDNKENKINQENFEIKILSNKGLNVRQISDLLNYSVGKVKIIKKRIA